MSRNSWRASVMRIFRGSRVRLAQHSVDDRSPAWPRSRNCLPHRSIGGGEDRRRHPAGRCLGRPSPERGTRTWWNGRCLPADRHARCGRPGRGASGRNRFELGTDLDNPLTHPQPVESGSKAATLPRMSVRPDVRPCRRKSDEPPTIVWSSTKPRTCVGVVALGTEPVEREPHIVAEAGAGDPGLLGEHLFRGVAHRRGRRRSAR